MRGASGVCRTNPLVCALIKIKYNTMPNILIVFVVVIMLWSAWGFFSSRVEQAEYTVVEKVNGYEIREYPAHIVAQTTVPGHQGDSLSAGFRIVAGYIFGGNTKKESIAMTAPVVTQKGEAESSRRLSRRR